MKPCDAKRTLLKRLAYLETTLDVLRYSHAKKVLVQEEAEALRHVLSLPGVGWLDEEKVEHLKVHERERLVERGREEVSR